MKRLLLGLLLSGALCAQTAFLEYRSPVAISFSIGRAPFKPQHITFQVGLPFPGPGTAHSTGGGGGTFTFLSSVCAASSTGLGVTTAAINTAGATLIVVAASYYFPGSTVVSSSSPSESFIDLTEYKDTFNTAKSRISYVIAPTGGATQTFTATGNNPSICVLAVKDTGGTNTFQAASDIGNAANAGATIQPGTNTPGVDNSLFIQAVTSTAPLFASPPSISGFGTNTLVGAGDWTVNSAGYGMAFQIQTTATAYNPTWDTTNGTNGGIAAASAIFNP